MTVKRSGHRYQGGGVRERRGHCPRAMTVLKKFNIFLDKIEAPPLSLVKINKFREKYGRASEVVLHRIIQND
jgi:hypothetical protein